MVNIFVLARFEQSVHLNLSDYMQLVITSIRRLLIVLVTLVVFSLNLFNAINILHSSWRLPEAQVPSVESPQKYRARPPDYMSGDEASQTPQPPQPPPLPRHASREKVCLMYCKLTLRLLLTGRDGKGFLGDE